MLDGQLRISLDGIGSNLEAGAVVFVPAGSELRIDAGPSGASAWVTSVRGLQATTADGAIITPPWAQ